MIIFGHALLENTDFFSSMRDKYDTQYADVIELEWSLSSDQEEGRPRKNNMPPTHDDNK